jgi:glycine oxidase
MASINRMRDHTKPVDVAIVGGGIAGLVCAWRARREGLSVTVLERDTLGSATSSVAAGMLAPVTEAEFGDAGGRLLELSLRSAQIWPQFAAELEELTGLDVGLLRTGTLIVARDEDEARELERQLAFRRSLGLRAERLRASAAREREPALAPTVRLAVESHDDHAVDPRRALAALRAACEACGVGISEHTTVESVALDGAGRRVTGLVLAGGERVMAGEVVLAAGAWSALVAGLPEDARVPVRPVKGQILRLRDPSGPGLVGRPVRFDGGYVVPRAEGRYAVGGTVEEKGFDTAPTAGGIYEVLRAASELVPGIDELQIEELSVGLRPGTPDNAPAIGPGALERRTWATGHYRNGILLAPLTGELVAATLTGKTRELEPLLAACAPGRFAAAHARASV